MMKAAAVCDDPASQGFKRMKASLLLKNSENFGEGFKPSEEGQVHVLVVVPGPAPVQFQTTTWKLAEKTYPVLNFQESTQPIIHIPEEYAEGSGLRVRKGGLHLYLRSELKEEWKALNANVVKTYAIQWIVGPPGTGKSCAAFAFACSMKRGRDWDVLWIDCTKAVGRLLSFILFRGVEKQTCNCARSQLLSILNSLRKNAVVFVDGYVKDRDYSMLDPCGLWQAEDKECRRLVIVSSMVSMGKDFQPDKFNKIDTAVTSSLGGLATSTPMLSEDSPGEVDLLQRFILPSWTLEEYKTALANDDFFEHVRLKFTDSDADMSLEERHELLDAKFFYVGGSARMMFDMSTEEAMRQYTSCNSCHCKHYAVC